VPGPAPGSLAPRGGGGVLVEFGATGCGPCRSTQARLSEGYLKKHQVTVLAKEYRSKKVSVLGQVKQPGTFQYSDSMSIIEAVSKAGGFTPSARKNAVRVTRKNEAKVETIIVAVDDIGRGYAPNFFLRPGDVIYVPERPF